MIRNIAIDLIDANPDQPRKTFEEGPLRELADSIEAEGLIQPITVVARGERYMIVAGERRFRAHKILADEGRIDEPVVTCRVRRVTDDEVAIQALVENLQREDVSPLEEADAFAALVDAGLEVKDIAKRCGVPTFRVEWRIRLKNLAPSVKRLFSSGAIDKQTAMEIARLDGEADQIKVLRMVNTGQVKGWKSVRNLVEAMLNPEEQTAMFGDSSVSDADVKAASGMMARIDAAAGKLAGGWKDGECVIASKVNPDEASKMAEKLKALQAMARTMERELRNTLAVSQAASG